MLVEAAERAQPAGTKGAGIGAPPVGVRARRGCVGHEGPTAAELHHHLWGGAAAGRAAAVGDGVEVLKRRGQHIIRGGTRWPAGAYLLDAVAIYKRPVTDSAAQVGSGHVVGVLIFGSKDSRAQITLEGRAAVIMSFGAHVLLTSFFATKVCATSVAFVLGEVMPLCIAVFVASVGCDKALDAISTMKHCDGDVILKVSL